MKHLCFNGTAGRFEFLIYLVLGHIAAILVLGQYGDIRNVGGFLAVGAYAVIVIPAMARRLADCGWDKNFAMAAIMPFISIIAFIVLTSVKGNKKSIQMTEEVQHDAA